MKFWELISAFRENLDALRTVLGAAEWSSTWGAAFEHRQDLIQRQERDVLDAPVPFELSQAVARSDQRVWSVSADGHLRLGRTGNVGERLLTTLEVHEEFGGSAIEEIREFGSLKVGRTGGAG